MVLASYGGGTNSTAMLIECVHRSEKVDLILFADTGGETPDTYKYIRQFSKWLVKHGMPEIRRVQTTDCNGTYITLEQKCRDLHQLPSLAYGFKSCSEKHKIRPQDKFMNNHLPAKEVWKSGDKITKLVGFDADEHHRIKEHSDKKYKVRYPLVEWDMGREECIETIRSAGLGLPGKSACFFCPSTKPHEIRNLAVKYPELAKRALEMEANAELTSVKGLGRKFSWADLLAQNELFDEQCNAPELACGCYDG